MDYRKAPIEATIDTFGFSSLWGSLLSGCRYSRGSLFSGTKNCEMKLTLALSQNEK